jgi:hypothetical protein
MRYADGAVTAGNAPGLERGSAAVVLADLQWSRKRGLTPVARSASCGIALRERTGGKEHRGYLRRLEKSPKGDCHDSADHQSCGIP